MKRERVRYEHNGKPTHMPVHEVCGQLCEPQKVTDKGQVFHCGMCARRFIGILPPLSEAG